MTAACDLTLDLHLPDLTPAQALAGWTTPALLKRWFTPAPVETVEAVCEPYAGGRFYTVMRLPDGQELAGESCYLVVEPERLVWTNTMTQGFRPAAPPPRASARWISP